MSGCLTIWIILFGTFLWCFAWSSALNSVITKTWNAASCMTVYCSAHHSAIIWATWCRNHSLSLLEGYLDQTWSFNVAHVILMQVLQTDRSARNGHHGLEAVTIKLKVAACIQYAGCLVFQAGRSKKSRIYGETEPLYCCIPEGSEWMQTAVTLLSHWHSLNKMSGLGESWQLKDVRLS